MTNPDPAGSVTVTFNTTEVAFAGMPPRSVTVNSTVPPAATTPPPWNCPSTVVPPGRVSNNRAGTNELYAEPGGKYPLTSAISCVPSETYKHTAPPKPTRAITAFGTLWPAVKFKFDANGR